MELGKEDSFFEDQEKNIYRVKEDCRVETITISAYLDELVLCNLPKLRQINLEAPVENAIIENCPKLVINRTPANHARISGCDAITWFSVDGEECEISDCKNLEELDISAFDCDYGMSVTIKDCKKLKKVCCEGREDIDLKILGCDALREFCNDGEYFPDADIEPNNTTILKTVPCSNFSLNDFGGIKQLYIGDQSIFNILDINDDEQFKNMIVDDIEMSVDCSGMEDLELVKIADGTNLYEANFSGCKNLRNLYIGSGTHCDFSLNLSGCPITDIELPWGNYDLNLCNCTNLKRIDIPSVESFCCCNCSNLEEVTLDEGQSFIDCDAFANCHNLKSIDLPEDTETISEGAFENCSQLKEIILPENVEKIGANAFKGCTALERVVCGNPFIEIDSKAFAGCTSLKQVEGLDLGCLLANDAFEDCEQLPPIVFYKTAAIVGSRSFANYEAMKKFIEENCKNEHLCLTGIVSGGAKGADTYGALYAKEKNLPLKEFIPDWDLYDRKAGLLRNIDIIENSDVCFAFWDGESHGTANSIMRARKEGKPCYIYTFSTECQESKPF